MNEPKRIACADRQPFAFASATHPGELRKIELLRVDDTAELLFKGTTVLVKVTGIFGKNITGTVLSFENYEHESINGVTLGDDVQFTFQKVQGWTR